MSRKHYIATARIIADRIRAADAHPVIAVANAKRATCEGIAHDLADVFAADNMQFQRERFLTACGIE